MFVEKRSLQFSAAAHVGVFLIAFFGFPSIFDRNEPEPMVMTIDVVPIGAITNLPPSDKPLSKWQQTDVKPTPKKVPPPQKEKAEPEKPLPKDAVPLPEPDKKVEKKKEEPKKEDVKEDKKEEEDFENILKDLQKQADDQAKPKPKDKKDTRNAEENLTKSDKPYDPTVPLSISETDAIRSQFVKCWRMPAGAVNANELLVKVRVQVSPAGEVTEVKLSSGQDSKSKSNPFFRAAADSAIRAVWKCSPLQNLPSDKYETWRDMELTFDPSELLY